MNLTVTLAIVAGVVLLAVVVHGAWTTRRSGPRLPQPPDSADPGRLEPTLGGLDPVAGGAADPEVGLPEPARTQQLARRAARIDALIDAIATVMPESPVSGEQALAHLPPTRRAGSKPFHIEGLDSETGDWELDRKSTRLNSSHVALSRMPSSA